MYNWKNSVGHGLKDEWLEGANTLDIFA